MRQFGKSFLAIQHARTLLDKGIDVVHITKNYELRIRCIEGVDYIVNSDGSLDIDGNEIFKLKHKDLAL